jgi:large subunit ribosomal protein L32e
MAEEKTKKKTSEAKPKAAKAEAKPKKETKPKAAKAEAKPKAAKPKEAKPKEAKPKEAKPKEAKPKTAKPKEAKPKTAKPKEAKPKTAKPKEAKPKKKPEVEEEEELEIVEEELEEEEEEAEEVIKKVKPDLDKETLQGLDLRKERSDKRPKFRRQEWFRYKRLGETYRKPRGMHSKMRTGRKYRPPRAKIGYRGPKAVRGLHSSGFEEILVHNEDGLEDLDPKRQAIRIGHSVGGRKRDIIQKKADELGLRVLNRW